MAAWVTTRCMVRTAPIRWLGGDGNDTLDGGADGDSMSGGAGDDIYLVDNVGDVVIESPNEGYDVVKSWVSITLPTNVEKLQLEGYDNINATGNDDANVIYGNEAHQPYCRSGGRRRTAG